MSKIFLKQWSCFQNFVKKHLVCSFHSRRLTYASLEWSFVNQNQIHKLLECTLHKQTCEYQQQNATFWENLVQYTGTKKSLNLKWILNWIPVLFKKNYINKNLLFLNTLWVFAKRRVNRSFFIKYIGCVFFRSLNFCFVWLISKYLKK